MDDSSGEIPRRERERERDGMGERMREIMPIISDSVEGPLADTSVQFSSGQSSQVKLEWRPLSF